MPSFQNNTKTTVMFAYWKTVMSGLNRNDEVWVNPNTTVEIPADACVDEYIIFVDYERIGKFWLDTHTRPYPDMCAPNYQLKIVDDTWILSFV